MAEEVQTAEEAVKEAEAKNQEAIEKLKSDKATAEESIKSITDEDLKELEEAKINLLTKKIEQAEGTYKSEIEKFLEKAKSLIKKYVPDAVVVLKYVMLIAIFYRIVIFPFL
jgi:predicted Zn-dependent protease